MNPAPDTAEYSTPIDSGPTLLWTCLAYVWAGILIAAKIWWDAQSLLLLSFFGVLFTFGVNRAIALYPRTYLGARMAPLTFLVAVFMLCDSFGEVAFQRQWRRSFDMHGQWDTVQNLEEKWSVELPDRWARRRIVEKGAATHFFKPTRLTPAIEFSLTRVPGVKAANAKAVAEDFLVNLPKRERTVIVSSGWVGYPGDRQAYRIVYQDPEAALVLRHETMFLLEGETVYAVSVASIPAWFERFTEDFDRYLTSLKFF